MPLLKPPEKPEPTTYRIDGRDLPRVSSILAVVAKPGLVAWKLRVGADKAAEISRTATEHGNAIHAAMKAVNGGDSLLSCPPGIVEPAETYYAWKEANVARVIATEKLLVSRSYDYAGTVDAIAELQTGEIAIIDYKTDKLGPWTKPKWDHAAQLAAYRLAAAEEGIIARRRIILHLPSNEPGTLIVRDYPNHRKDTEAWLNLLALYQWLQQWTA